MIEVQVGDGLASRYAIRIADVPDFRHAIISAVQETPDQSITITEEVEISIVTDATQDPDLFVTTKIKFNEQSLMKSNFLARGDSKTYTIEASIDHAIGKRCIRLSGCKYTNAEKVHSDNGDYSVVVTMSVKLAENIE